jgi:hypothetical protein
MTNLETVEMIRTKFDESHRGDGESWQHPYLDGAKIFYNTAYFQAIAEGRGTVECR